MSDFDAVLHDAFRTRLMRRMGHAVRHDLRSPMQGMSLCLDLVQKSVDALAAGDPARVAIEKAVAMARRELVRMEHTTRGLLCDAGILEDGATRFDLAQLTREVAHHFVTEAAMRGVELALSVPPEPVYVSGRRAEISRALLVCIVDALDSVPDGGRTEIALRANGERAAVEVLVATPGAGPRPQDADEYSFASMGLRIAREWVEARGGEFISEERGPARHRATGVRLPLDRN